MLVPGGGHCRAHQPKDADRPNADTRRWYHTARWRALRARVLLRDVWCGECLGRGWRVLSTDADHVIPHRGDLALFWNEGNLRGLCHAHHSAKTGRGQ